MNLATFAGRIGRDAEVRQTNKDSVTGFSLAVDVGYGDSKRTLWVACSMWGTRGEKVAPYLTKGSSVTVSGDVDIRQYDGKDGTPKAELTLNVQRLTLQGSKDASRDSRGGEGVTPSSSPSRQEKTPQQREREKAAAGDDFSPDSDIPFAFHFAAPLLGLMVAAHGAASYLGVA